jgi:hypothetical protein
LGDFALGWDVMEQLAAPFVSVREMTVWLWTVLNHWQVLLTGGIVTAFLTIVQARRQKAFSWSFNRRLFGGFLLCAMFLSWQEERRAKTSSQIALQHAEAALRRSSHQMAEQSQRACLPVGQISLGQKSPNVLGVSGDVSVTYGSGSDARADKKK